MCLTKNIVTKIQLRNGVISGGVVLFLAKESICWFINFLEEKLINITDIFLLDIKSGEGLGNEQGANSKD